MNSTMRHRLCTCFLVFIKVVVTHTSQSEIKRVHGRGTKELCNLLCKRQTRPDCTDWKIDKAACVLLSNQVLRVKSSTMPCASKTVVCPEGFHNSFLKGSPAEHGSFLRSCYKVLHAPMEWWSASRACKNLDAELVSIETMDEQRHITKALKRNANTGFWTAGRNGRWTTTNQVFGFTLWYQAEQNGLVNTRFPVCVALLKTYGYTWSGAPCFKNYTSLCERRVSRY